MDGGTWWAAVHGVPKSWAQLSDFTFTFHFHALEKEMATHSSTLAWRIPWMEEPGGLPSLGSHRVGHDWSDLAAAAAAHCRQHNDVSLSYRDINVSYLFDKWSICGWEQADKVSRKDCRIEGFFFFKYPLPFNATSSRLTFRRRSRGSLPHCSGQCFGHCGEEFHKLTIKEIKNLCSGSNQCCPGTDTLKLRAARPHPLSC